MAIAQIIAAINIVAYGVIPLGLWWVIIHYKPTRLALSGLFVHMVIVCGRTAIRTFYPDSIFWDWNDLHTATAAISAVCLVVGILREYRK
jgi:hypothetical protein